MARSGGGWKVMAPWNSILSRVIVWLTPPTHASRPGGCLSVRRSIARSTIDRIFWGIFFVCDFKDGFCVVVVVVGMNCHRFILEFFLV